MFTIAVSLLDSSWPLDPCRQISVKLLNLKDEHGRKSYSALTVMQMTGGKTKLGGQPNVNQPKPVMKVTHHIPAIFDEDPKPFHFRGRGRGFFRGFGYGGYRREYPNPEDNEENA